MTAAAHIVRPDVIESIYEAAVDGGTWDIALERLMALTGGVQGMAIWYEAQSHAVIGKSGTFDEALVATCMAEYHVNPWTEPMADVAPGHVVVLDEHVPFEALRKTGFYADILHPLDMAHGAALVLATEDDGRFSLGVGRHMRAGPFGPAQTDIMQAYGAHAARATALARRFDGLAQIRRAELAALDVIGTATIIVDEEGSVLLANRAASALESQGIIGLAKVPECTDRAAATRFRTSVMVAARGVAPPPVSFRDAMGMPLVLMAAPLGVTVADRLSGAGARGRAAAALFVFTAAPGPGPSMPMLQALFGLTPAEARVAAEIALGDGEREAARRLGIGLNSLKTHRQRIFLKIGVTRRSELVRLLARLPFDR
ncbi:helix-turn-helix transcriptional regulator [Roseomonas hellenica]|uniref:Helix-turn-helix transcriptional regulator n=1 Tax=Plastoroseomonas hellenica TaxID=2687306 RepID=A0ABS5F582_9PROT|nr:helix-turn-helix transcriptional regulator [Plastoroseomonas hellenica]MBR0667661.1 helix-turn-helix transcriptional regulator [Plastoroseomonas hellenica]